MLIGFLCMSDASRHLARDRARPQHELSSMSVAEPESDQSPPLKFRILRAVPVLLVLGLLVHFLLPRLDTIGDSLATLRTLVPWAIGLSLVMEVLSYVANGALLQTIIHLAG